MAFAFIDNHDFSMGHVHIGRGKIKTHDGKLDIAINAIEHTKLECR